MPAEPITEAPGTDLGMIAGSIPDGEDLLGRYLAHLRKSMCLATRDELRAGIEICVAICQNGRSTAARLRAAKVLASYAAIDADMLKEGFKAFVAPPARSQVHHAITIRPAPAAAEIMAIVNAVCSGGNDGPNATQAPGLLPPQADPQTSPRPAP